MNSREVLEKALAGHNLRLMSFEEYMKETSRECKSCGCPTHISRESCISCDQQDREEAELAHQREIEEYDLQDYSE